MMQDMAILTGGQFIAEELGLKLENVGIESLGKAKRVIVDKDNTTIVGGGGDKEAIKGRAAEIRRLIADTTKHRRSLSRHGEASRSQVDCARPQ
jgi:chaperonin GroEL